MPPGPVFMSVAKRYTKDVRLLAVYFSANIDLALKSQDGLILNFLVH